VVVFSSRVLRLSDYRSLISAYLCAIGLEAVAIWYYYLENSAPQPGDWAHFLFDSAHASGMLLGIGFLYILGRYLTDRKLFHLLAGIACAGAFWMTGTNQATVGFGVGLSLLLIYWRIKAYRWVVLCICLVAVSNPLQVLTKISLSYDGRIPKVTGFLHTLSAVSDRPGTVLLGFGVGTFGSRAAVARSSPRDLAKPDGSRIPEMLVGTPELTKIHLSELYSPYYYQRLINSGVTGSFYTPFSTWGTLLGETGVLGILLILAILLGVLVQTRPFRGRHHCDFPVALAVGTTAIAMMIVFGYENWLEHPQVIFLFWMLSAYLGKIRRVESLAARGSGRGTKPIQ
jgi:hypothetical protein